MAEITNKLLTFNIDSDALTTLENHIDTTRLKLRKAGVKNFTRKQIFRYLIESSIKQFDHESFIRFLNTQS